MRHLSATHLSLLMVLFVLVVLSSRARLTGTPLPCDTDEPTGMTPPASLTLPVTLPAPWLCSVWKVPHDGTKTGVNQSELWASIGGVGRRPSHMVRRGLGSMAYVKR